MVWDGVGGAGEALVCAGAGAGAGAGGAGGAGDIDCTGDGGEEVSICIPKHGIMAEIDEGKGGKKRISVSRAASEAPSLLNG